MSMTRMNKAEIVPRYIALSAGLGPQIPAILKHSVTSMTSSTCRTGHLAC